MATKGSKVPADFSSLTESQREYFCQEVSRDYYEEPVDIETFLFDEEYLGGSLGQGTAPVQGELYPFWLEKLKQIFNDPAITEVILTGPIGLGKSTMSAIANLFMLHHLLCLKKPQKFYGNIGAKTIKIFVFSITEDKAHGTIYQTMQNFMLDSPWFKRVGEVQESTKNKWVEFPNRNIEIGLGSPFKEGQGQVGEDIFGGCFPGSARFLTDDGDWEQFEDHVGEEIKVKSFLRDSQDLITARARVVVTGVEELVKINLENNQTIYTTEDQNFLVEDTKAGEVTEKAVSEMNPDYDRIVRREVA